MPESAVKNRLYIIAVILFANKTKFVGYDLSGR